MRSVIFTRNDPPYMAGDIAGFPPEEAERRVASGAARFKVNLEQVVEGDEDQRPDDADPGEQISGMTVDGEQLGAVNTTPDAEGKQEPTPANAETNAETNADEEQPVKPKGNTRKR